MQVEHLDGELSSPKPVRTDVNYVTDVAKHQRRRPPFQFMLSGWYWWRFFLLLIDNVISGILIGPLTVFYWHGTWTLIERHWFPVHQVDSDGQERLIASATNGWICFAVGNIGLLILVFV